MTQPEALHPNLALIASRYDAIIEAMERAQLSPADARAQIAQLEARDDQGVRWSIDPDSGSFVRRTAFGDAEFDTPPQSGVKTLDPHDINDNARVVNPHLRLRDVQAVGMTAPPTSLAGATQHLNPQSTPSPLTRVIDTVMGLPNRTKGIAVGIIAALALVGFVATGDDEPSTDQPVPTQEQPLPQDDEPAKKK